jgi:stress-induced-phosphoprotein 1
MGRGWGWHVVRWLVAWCCRNPETLQRLNETERALKKKQEEEYINMELCNEQKEEGNQFFKEQKFPEAIKCYTEAIARGPPSVNEECYKLFSNRAACYTKLGALPEAEKDADRCIELKPDFAKGYSRKAHAQFLTKEYTKAMKTYELGLTHDPESAELKQGLQRCMQQLSAAGRGELSEEELKERQVGGLSPHPTQCIRNIHGGLGQWEGGDKEGTLAIHDTTCEQGKNDIKNIQQEWITRPL